MPVWYRIGACDAEEESGYGGKGLSERTQSLRFARMGADQAQLAPAAGAGVGKLFADALLADPEFLPALKAAAMDGLRANRSYYDGAQKRVVTEPDARVRIQSVALLLAHMEGEPIKRVVHQHLGSTEGVDVLGALRDSPALQTAMERALEKARFRDRPGRGRRPTEKQAEPVDVEFEQ